MKNGLNNMELIRIDNELNDIINYISRYYSIPILDLKTIMETIDINCKANVWNLGNPMRCSRNKTNQCYCSIHQNQINKYGKLRLGHYNGEPQQQEPDIENTFNKDDYFELDCDLIEYNEQKYYIEKQEVYAILDREHNIVDILKDQNMKQQILLEYNKIC